MILVNDLRLIPLLQAYIIKELKKKTKLNEIETFTHLKVKIPVKSGPN